MFSLYATIPKANKVLVVMAITRALPLVYINFFQLRRRGGGEDGYYELLLT